MKIIAVFFVGAALLTDVAAGTAGAQSPQAGSVKLIVPFPPGGTGDVIARLFTQQMQTSTQSFVVENRPGASTIIATEQVVRAAPDGATLLEVANAFVINPSLRANLPFDPFSLEPVCLLANSPQVMAVNSASPYRSFAEFLAAAKQHPGEFSYASVGPATTPHITGEMLRRVAQINLNYVPFPGGAPAVNVLLGGHVTAVMANLSEVMEHVAAGKLRPIVTTAGTRLREMPDVPTLKESGFDLEGAAWFGVVAPPKTPRDIIAKLSSQFTTAMQATDVQTKLAAQGLYPSGLCGEDFGAHLRQQYELFGRIIREVNMKAE
ncbi:MAG: Bug family tripartite tricarboxylate transporter substrate binding protein [Xanthobacteraceae bacterium]